MNAYIDEWFTDITTRTAVEVEAALTRQQLGSVTPLHTHDNGQYQDVMSTLSIQAVVGRIGRLLCAYNCVAALVDLFLADRTNGRAIGTVLRLSSSVCDVMYCG